MLVIVGHLIIAFCYENILAVQEKETVLCTKKVEKNVTSKEVMPDLLKRTMSVIRKGCKLRCEKVEIPEGLGGYQTPSGMEIPGGWGALN